MDKDSIEGELKTFVIPFLKSLSQLKEGQTFSFMYKTTLDHYTISSLVSYYKETKQTMHTELETLIEKIEESIRLMETAGVVNVDIVNSLIENIESSLPKFEVISIPFVDDLECIEFISDVHGRLSCAIPKLRELKDKISIMSFVDISNVNISTVSSSTPIVLMKEEVILTPRNEDLSVYNPSKTDKSCKADSQSKITGKNTQTYTPTKYPSVFDQMFNPFDTKTNTHPNSYRRIYVHDKSAFSKSRSDTTIRS